MPSRRLPPCRAFLLALIAAFVLGSGAAVAQVPPPRSDASEQQLKDAVAKARDEFGASSDKVIVALRELADYYWSEHRLQDTAAALSEALAIAEKSSPEDFGTTRLMQNLAAVYNSDQHPERAAPLLRRALEIREMLLGPDHVDVAVVLLNLGDTHRILGEYAVALPLMQRALAIREKGLGPDHPDVAWATSYIGRVYRELGDSRQAKLYFERTLAVREKALGGTHRFVSRSLSDLAMLYREMGDYEGALPLLERALEIDRKNLGAAHPDLVSALVVLGVTLREMGEYGRALPMLERALQIDMAAFGPDHTVVAERLTELGFAYRSMGDLAQATAMYERALAIEESQVRPSPRSIANRLQNLGVVYERAGDYARALPLLQRAIEINERLYGPENPRVASSLATLAMLHRGQGELDLATQEIERAVRIEEKSGGAMHPRVAMALLNAGLIQQAKGDRAAASQALGRALLIASSGNQPETLWRTQQALASVSAPGDVEVSIYWGKQAVNTVQSLRGRLTGLSSDIQRTFLSDKRRLYVTLADQLIDVGRLSEAQEVLAMLKQEELYDFIARAGPDDARDARASFVGPAEVAANRRWQEISAQVAQLGRDAAELSRKARLGLTEEEQARRSQVEADLVIANRHFDAFLAELSREFTAAPARRAEEIGSRQLRNLVVMQDVLKELGSDTVLLHYVVAENRVAIILTTPDAQIARETRIPAAELNRKVLAFRQALAGQQDVTARAKDLHDLLIRPVAEDLRQARARNLMLSLDGTLRYLPFAALHDGKRWLVETYALSIYTEAARAQLLRQPRRDWTMTGLGVSRAVSGFAALPAVREELEGIRRTALRGDVYLDDQFTADRLRDALADPKPVMHIASHFQFRPGTFANSFLVLGDGNRLTLQDVRDRRLRFSNVELLTLSACDTAMGGGVDETGAEVEGFGALAQQQGAQAVLATLWPVVDGSTARFMQSVYHRRQSQSGLSKSEALREAQLTFVRGEVLGPGKRPLKLTHPFYWAPYVLMGNWR